MEQIVKWSRCLQFFGGKKLESRKKAGGLGRRLYIGAYMLGLFGMSGDMYDE